MGKLLLFSGSDTAAITAAAKRTLAELAGEEPDEFTTEILAEDPDNGPDTVLERLIESLNTPPFFGGEKTILVKNFSAFAEEPAKSVKSPTGVAKLLRRLSDVILNEFPDDVNLILSGPDVDSRKGLAKACLKVGSAEFLKKPDIKDWGWKQDVMTLLRHRFQAAGITMPIAAFEYLTEVIGADTDRIGVELEKIICYAGESPTLDQVRQICRGTREAHFFAFTKSLGERDLNGVMEALTQTMEHTKQEDGECIRLLRMSANHFRKLLDAKLAMHVLKCNNAKDLRARMKRLADAERERLVGNSLLTASDWSVGSLGEQSAKYTGQELRKAIHRLAIVDRSNVSSNLPNRLVLETLIMQIVPRKDSA